MERDPSFAENISIEIRVLGWQRTFIDAIYLRLALTVPYSIQYRFGWLLGARGYFDWRDSVEFPILIRFYSRRFLRWQIHKGIR